MPLSRTSKALCIALLACLQSASIQASEAPSGMMVDLLREPMQSVITDPRPVFSWIVNDPRRDAVQTAFQILVASSADLLEPGRADLWDSGRVPSAQSTSVEYAGTALRSKKILWWKLRVWDGDGNVSAYSAPQSFQTGDFSPPPLAWPAESRWTESPAGGRLVLENRPTPHYVNLAPVAVRETAKGRTIADFGRTAYATLKLTLESRHGGEKVVVHLGEKSAPDGTVDARPGGTIGYQRVEFFTQPGKRDYLIDIPRKTKNQPHTQLLPPEMAEVCPFRFAEIENAPAPLTADALRQHALLYPFHNDSSSFVSSSPQLDSVYELCKHTLRVAPFMAMYVDGTRERMPYEADSYIAQQSHYALDRDYAAARYTWEFLTFHASWPAEWSQHIMLMAWADYEQTGDARPLVRFYRELQAKTLAMLEDDTGLISTRTERVTKSFLESIHYEGKDFRDIVDWPPGTPEGAKKEAGNGSPFPEGERDGFVFCDYNAVVNAFYYRNLVLMERIAAIVEKPGDARSYREHAARVKERFNATFFRPQYGNVYVDGNTTRHASLHANLFALAFGLVPEDAAQDVCRFIQGKGMACGPYPAQFLLEALIDHGAANYALQLMTSDSDRGWLNMIRQGATTTAEAWDIKYKRNLGWTHAWGAAPANIIARKILGVEPLAPAFAKISVRPQISILQHASGRVPTIRGPVDVAWQKTANGYRCSIRIPANTRAIVTLPGLDTSAFKESRRKTAAICTAADKNVFEIGAGAYEFEYTGGAL